MTLRCTDSQVVTWPRTSPARMHTPKRGSHRQRAAPKRGSRLSQLVGWPWQILASLSRVPGKSLVGVTLKLLQVQVAPDKNGFGIGLTDSNIVASLVANGAAGRSELKKGDIIVGVDGCNLGTQKLVQVMERGQKLWSAGTCYATSTSRAATKSYLLPTPPLRYKSSYCFSVVRPAMPEPTDSHGQPPGPLGEATGGAEAEAELSGKKPKVPPCHMLSAASSHSSSESSHSHSPVLPSTRRVSPPLRSPPCSLACPCAEQALPHLLPQPAGSTA